MHQTKIRKLVIIVILLIFSAVLFFYFFDFFEKCFSALSVYFFGGESNLNPKGEFLKVVLQTIGGVFVIIGACAALRRVKIMEQNRIGEKFSNAVEHFGSDKTGIFIGSIYALNEIAINNKEYKQQVFNTLSSHIRDRMKNEKEWSSLTLQEKENYQLPIEVQAILDIFFRNKNQDYYDSNIIDLRNCKLYKAKLNYADMRNADLHKTQLQGAFLSKANLAGVDLSNANLSGAKLHDTNLIGAELSNSFFIGAELNSTKLQFAKLRKSHFECSSMDNVHFECAFLHKAIFIGCNSIGNKFHGADLSRVNFSGSSLVRQQFICSTLMETKFYGAYIKDSNFKGAKLAYTRFNGACSKLSSRREELSFDFFSAINQRIDKKTEFYKSVSFGKLSDEERKEVIGEFKEEIKDKKLIKKFISSINNPLFEDDENIDKGLLSKKIAQNVITQFNKAIQLK